MLLKVLIDLSCKDTKRSLENNDIVVAEPILEYITYVFDYITWEVIEFASMNAFYKKQDEESRAKITLKNIKTSIQEDDEIKNYLANESCLAFYI